MNKSLLFLQNGLYKNYAQPQPNLNIMYKRSCLILILLAVLFAAPARTEQVTAQREVFLQAEKALHSRDRDTYQELAAQLQDYPLYPYLIYQELLQDMRLEKASEIRSFFNDFAHTPLDSRLRNKWLHYLAEKEQWQMFLKDCPPRTSGDLACYRAKALQQTGQKEKSLKLTRELWLHPYSRPDSCDPVFAYWQQTDGIQAQHFWQRTLQAIQAENAGLVKYLRPGLEEDKKELADFWLDMHQDPQLALKKNWSRVPEQIKTQALTTGFKQLVRKDVLQAARDWSDLKEKQQWTVRDYPRIEKDIALFMALRDKPGAFKSLSSLPAEFHDSKTRGWMLRAALMRQDWQQVLQAFRALPPREKTSQRWQYWRARALQALDREQEARNIYQGLSQDRDYFAQLSADRLQQEYNFDNEPVPEDMEALLQLWQRPAIQRAVELYRLQRLPQARREWNQALGDSGAAEYRAAAVLARDLQWPDRAIFAAASAPGVQDLEIMFPVPYEELILEQSWGRELDQAWVMALMRQESAFMLDARSPAGALGLMQIMPGTGENIAHQLGESFSHPFQLLNPEINIRYGTFYLHRQLERFEGNLVLASAAYNAGRGSVLRWLSRRPQLPADIWIECIPYAETRNYVQKILQYTTIYEIRLGRKPSRISYRMPEFIGDPESLAVHQVLLPLEHAM